MNNKELQAETTVEQSKNVELLPSANLAQSPLLAAVFLSTKEKQEQFHKELKDLLAKYKAELTIEDFGRNYLEDWKIVVDFKYDESFFEKEDTGVVPQLIIGRWADGT